MKKPHNFRVGDVVKRKDGKKGLYVVSGTKGWTNNAFTHDDGRRDAFISLCKKIGTIPLSSYSSEYKLVKRREDVGKQWWKIFPKGEK